MSPLFLLTIDSMAQCKMFFLKRLSLSFWLHSLTCHISLPHVHLFLTTFKFPEHMCSWITSSALKIVPTYLSLGISSNETSYVKSPSVPRALGIPIHYSMYQNTATVCKHICPSHYPQEQQTHTHPFISVSSTFRCLMFVKLPTFFRVLFH